MEVEKKWKKHAASSPEMFCDTCIIAFQDVEERTAHLCSKQHIRLREHGKRLLAKPNPPVEWVQKERKLRSFLRLPEIRPRTEKLHSIQERNCNILENLAFRLNQLEYKLQLENPSLPIIPKVGLIHSYQSSDSVQIDTIFNVLNES